jgi:hypothetical protein
MMRLIAVRYGMGGCGAHELSLCAAELTVSHHSLARVVLPRPHSQTTRFEVDMLRRTVQPIELECLIQR